MPEATATETAPAPSFLDSPEFESELSTALAASGKMPQFAPKIEAQTAAPPAKPTDAPAAEVKPDATKPEVKADTKPDDDEIPADIKSPNAQSSWKKLKESKKAIEAERDTLRKEHGTLKSELEALKKAATTPAQKANLADDPEYQSLKKLVEAKETEAKELSERLQLLDVEKHPKFEAYFKGKLDQQFTIAKEIGGEHGDKIVEILQLPEGAYRKQQLNEIAVELDPIALSQLGAVVNSLRGIKAEREAEISKSKESYQQLQAQQKIEAEKKRGEMESLFKSVRNEVTDKEKGLAVFQERDGDEAWNKGVRERLALVDAMVAGKLPAEDAARYVHWAAAAPALLQQWNADRAESASKISALEKEIASLRAVNPNPGGETPGGETAVRSNKTGIDALMEDIQKIVPGQVY
jgi:hypothetical protein